MKEEKKGVLLAILVVSILAFGCGTICGNSDIGDQICQQILPSQITSPDSEQTSTVDDQSVVTETISEVEQQADSSQDQIAKIFNKARTSEDTQSKQASIEDTEVENTPSTTTIDENNATEEILDDTTNIADESQPIDNNTTTVSETDPDNSSNTDTKTSNNDTTNNTNVNNNATKTGTNNNTSNNTVDEKTYTSDIERSSQNTNRYNNPFIDDFIITEEPGL